MIWLAKLFGVNTLVVWLVVAVLGVGGIWAYGSYQHFTGKREGIAQERAAWTEAQNILRREMDRERREAQDRIDEIERSYLDQREADTRRWHQALENAITEHMEAEDAADNSCPVRSAFPRGVSQRLDQIGR